MKLLEIKEIDKLLDEGIVKHNSDSVPISVDIAQAQLDQDRMDAQKMIAEVRQAIRKYNCVCEADFDILLDSIEQRWLYSNCLHT